MTLNEFMVQFRHTSVTLGRLVNLTPSLIRHQRLKTKKVSARAARRLYWASKGRLTPEALGVDPALVALPDLSKLPDPDEPDVNWRDDCVPVLEAIKAEKQGANP